MIAGFCSRMKLESFLGFATFRKTPTDLNPSERRQAACCGRGLKDAPSANFDHARRKIQRLKTDSLKQLRMQRTCMEMDKLRLLDPSQESEKTRPGSLMPVCIAVPRIQTEFLIPWISTMSSSTLLLTLTLLLLFLLPSRHSSL